jgi:hypothetical protein
MKLQVGSLSGTFLALLIVLIPVPGLLLDAAGPKPGSGVTPTIEVGPNMLVSRDGDFAHMETSVGVNPRNPKNLVGASITASRGEGGFACKTYTSLDGGSTWTDSVIPEQLEWGGGDPQVDFGPHGTAYFTGLAFVKDDKGNAKGGLFFYRSEDGGKNWEKPTDLGYNYDHEVMVVDRSFGRFAGRVYISVLYGEYPEYTVGIFRSDDDGRTFTGPVDAASGHKILGINTAANIVLFRDGTLLLPYVDFEYEPEKAKKSHTMNSWFVSSSDGGVTFSAPSKIGTQEFRPFNNKEPRKAVEPTPPTYAVDLSDLFPDRIYIAWTDYRSGAYKIYLSYSSDKGKTWSPAKAIFPDTPPWASQYQPSIAVNKQGVVGVTWLDTRNAPNRDDEHYDEYFSASLDGGETFSVPVRVSSATSTPFGQGNLRMQAMLWKMAVPEKNEEEVRMSFISAGARWPAGGDYLGLTADREGVFHPLWADARTGTFQLETAAISVIKPPAEPKPAVGKTNVRESGERVPLDATKTTSLAPLVSTSLSGKVEMVFDPISFDAATNIMEIPTRLRNISNTTIYAPITVAVQKFGSGMGDEMKDFAPTFVNATNGKDGSGAIFDYSAALSTSKALPAGSLSGEVVWRVKLQDPMKIPDFHVSLQGMIAQVK